MSADVQAIIFDLDGTLYVNKNLAGEIKRSAAAYIAGLKGVSNETAAILIRETREKLSREKGREATLSAVCAELGGSAAGFHAFATPLLHPEKHLRPDHRVTKLLAALAGRYELYIYTNNNQTLTDRVLIALGLSGLFDGIFTIEDSWRPKPDRKVLSYIFATIRKDPRQCLFVGDRYDVDLRLPVEMGCASFLVTDIQGLLTLETVLPL